MAALVSWRCRDKENMLLQPSRAGSATSAYWALACQGTSKRARSLLCVVCVCLVPVCIGNLCCRLRLSLSLSHSLYNRLRLSLSGGSIVIMCPNERAVYKYPLKRRELGRLNGYNGNHLCVCWVQKGRILRAVQLFSSAPFLTEHAQWVTQNRPRDTLSNCSCS